MDLVLLKEFFMRASDPASHASVNHLFNGMQDTPGVSAVAAIAAMVLGPETMKGTDGRKPQWSDLATGMMAGVAMAHGSETEEMKSFMKAYTESCLRGSGENVVDFVAKKFKLKENV